MYSGRQITASESHPWPPPSGGGLVDIGGPFSTSKTEGRYSPTHVSRTWTRGLDEWPYSAEKYILRTQVGVPIITDGPSWPAPFASSEEELRTAGTTAIARCKPTSSTGEASTAIGETYREGIPHATGAHTWRDRALTAKNAGGEYLNVKFGWQPLVSEILSFGSSVTKARDILDQYNADKGNVVRRRYDFPPIESSNQQVLGDAFLSQGASISAPWIPASTMGKLTLSTRETKSRWFSGAFIYGFPQASTPFGKMREYGAEADRLFGISLTPDVLWNLAPWSWAIDWFSNVGDGLSIIGDMMSQGLVMKYGYIMEETSRRTSYGVTGASVNGISVTPGAASFEVKTKVRYPASPFGFGVTWEGLSTAQGAILAALGASRR